MKIALNGRFYAAPVTGVQRFAREVTIRLVSHADVVVMLPRGVDVPPTLVGASQIGRLRGHAWEQTELPWRVKAAGCDVCLNLAGTLPATGGPHVGVVHDVLPITHPHWFAPAFATWYRVAVGRNARRAARIITVSQWSAQNIVRALDVDPQRVVVARQGTGPIDRPASQADVARVRDRFGLPARYVLGLGYGDPRKNTAFLVEVMRAWRKREPESPALVLAGKSSVRVHGRPKSAVLAFPEARLLGRVPDDELRALYTGALALAFPSLAEGFGRPPLEAAACGTPAIVAPYESASEALGDGVAIEPLDVESWVDRLHTLTRPGPERAALIERGRRVAQRASWDDAVETVLAACADASAQPLVGIRA